MENPINEALIQACPVGCDSQLMETDIELPEGKLRQCSVCGQLISACSQQRYADTMQDFDVEAGTMPEGKSATRHQKRMGAILQQAMGALGKAPGDVAFLDVGCSSGSVLKVAQAINIGAVQGVEPAPKAAKTAQDLGFDVFSGFLEEARYDDQSFDLVTLFEVIEHLSDARPIAQETYRILKPGGIWLIGTGNAQSWTAERLREQWEYFSIAQNGGHISFFNPLSIRKMAATQGFEMAYLSTKRVLHATPENKTAMNKVQDELMALPARKAEKGHDMLAALRKPFS